MAIEQPDYPTRISIEEDDSPSNAFISRNRCCFQLPCFGSSPSTTARLGGASGGAAHSSSPSTTSLWGRLRDADSDNRWWARPFRAFKKLREWSEIVAGPQWKTFIRRFNRHRRHNHHHHHSAAAAGKFQYDPLSYALNFDEGQHGQNGQFEDDYGQQQFPDFSSRYASIPISAKSSMDLGRGGAPAG